MQNSQVTTPFPLSTVARPVALVPQRQAAYVRATRRGLLAAPPTRCQLLVGDVVSRHTFCVQVGKQPQAGRRPSARPRRSRLPPCQRPGPTPDLASVGRLAPLGARIKSHFTYDLVPREVMHLRPGDAGFAES